MKPDEIFGLFNNPQGQKFLDWLESKTKDEYPATLDGVKAAMDISFLAGRRSLVKEIKQQINKGQNNE